MHAMEQNDPGDHDEHPDIIDPSAGLLPVFKMIPQMPVVGAEQKGFCRRAFRLGMNKAI